MLRSIGLALLSLALIATTVQAQQQVDVSGTIVGVEGTVILIKDMVSGSVFRCDTSRSFRNPRDNVTYTIREAASVNVTGTEDPRNLAPGMSIQFTVKLANKKIAVDDVAAATLITPGPQSQLGILNSNPVEEPAADGDEKEKKPKPQNVEECLVAGTITKATNGLLTVSFPGEKGIVNVKVRMAAGATVDVSGDNLSIARIGDKITATGTGWILPHFLAREIKVEHVPAVDEKLAKQKLAEEMKAAKAAKGKPGDKDDRGGAFGVGDPEDKKPDPVAAKPKIKLQVLKVN